MKYVVFYNPQANNKMGYEEAQKVSAFYPNDTLEFVNALENDYQQVINTTDADGCILVGGDGTVNYFINHVDCDNLTKDIYYFGGGSGNDFLTDIGGTTGGEPVLINKYLANLPTVLVKGQTYKFINGIGYGIDGYCCQVADEIRAKDSTKKIDYTGIAIKGLLFHYKPTQAEVIVDGESKTYKKVWLSPCMIGRHYGGGMIPTPEQDRFDGNLSVMTMFGKGRLPTLMVFPSIFKGEHVKKSCVEVRKGKQITVKFDSPTALQIDGETILDVLEFTATSAK